MQQLAIVMPGKVKQEHEGIVLKIKPIAACTNYLTVRDSLTVAEVTKIGLQYPRFWPAGQPTLTVPAVCSVIQQQPVAKCERSLAGAEQLAVECLGRFSSFFFRKRKKGVTKANMAT